MQTDIIAASYTYDDYLKIDDDNQYELIGGKLILVPAPRTIHQRIKIRLVLFIADFIRKNDLGEILDAPTDVVLTEKDKPQPDILFVSKERLSIITETNVQGAPDLVIEILSPSTSKRDRVEKSRLYYKHGVKEYWIVDPDGKVVEIFVPGEKNWNLFQAYGAEETLTSLLLTGLEIQLKDIFK
ncbi:MAG: Uma2 family endonuclease [Bacillota bacterium]